MTESSDSKSPCVNSALMPLYLVALGGVCKTLLRYFLLRYEAKELRSALEAQKRSEEDQEDRSEYHLNIGSEVNNEGMEDDQTPT